jgi:hypothetical protein
MAGREFRRRAGLVDRSCGRRLTEFDGRIGATSWSWYPPEGVSYGDTTGLEGRAVGGPSSVARLTNSLTEGDARGRSTMPLPSVLDAHGRGGGTIPLAGCPPARASYQFR